MQSLLHPTRVAFNAIMCPIFKTDQLEHFGDTAGSDVGRNTIEIGEILDVLKSGEPPVQPAFTAEQNPDPAANLLLMLRNIESQNTYLTRSGKENCRQDFSECGLPCTIRTQKAKQFALRHR